MEASVTQIAAVPRVRVYHYLVQIVIDRPGTYNVRRGSVRPRAVARILALILVLHLLLTSAVSNASGFTVPGSLSIAGLGTGDTLVANPKESGALAYNPAAMSFHEGREAVLGIIAVWPNSRVTPEGSNETISDDPKSPIYVPNVYLMNPITTKWAVGLGINTPFGLETNWRKGTFPAFSGPLAPLEPSRTRLEMFNVSPNFSYRINEHVSVAAGLDYYTVRDATSDSQGVQLSGDGNAFGWNAAFMYVKDRWSTGLSYQSHVDARIDGDFDASSFLGVKVDSKTELDFPAIFRAGVRYQASADFAIEMDFERTGWSRFDEIVVKSKDALPAAGISEGSTLAVTTNNWSDTNSYRVGATYRFRPTWQLRLGYTLNQNPQPETQFSPRYPNARRHVFSAGIKREYKEWDMEAGIMYARWENREINNSKPFAGGDANGTTAFNGKYKLDGYLAGIGAIYHF